MGLQHDYVVWGQQYNKLFGRSSGPITHKNIMPTELRCIILAIWTYGAYKILPQDFNIVT